MKKMFYSHLVEISELEIELNLLDLSHAEKEELISHVHSSIHYRVLDTVLSDLSAKDKKIIINHINNENHEKIWERFFKNASQIEEKIKNTVEDVSREFVEEIEKIKNKHKKQ
jgi:hypothetical protein